MKKKLRGVTFDGLPSLPYRLAMDLTLTIPDDLAARLGAKDLSRQALEALAAEAFRAGRLNESELRRLLRLSAHARLDGFLKAHGIGVARLAAESEQRHGEARRTHALVARFRAFRAGKTLDGLDPAALIRKGRR